VARLLLALVLALAAIALAAVIRRRRATPAPTPGGWHAPAQVDRHDFSRPEAPFLVALFSSATCQTCAAMAEKVAVLTSSEVAVDVVEVTAQPELHRKYRVEAVPIVVVVDGQGVARASFIGPTSATDLWAAVAEVRQPGSSPEPGLGRD
jgi:Thioredoxin domain